MQIERLINMVFYLIHGRQVTARELADYFHVSTRTIYRDINTLTLAGIPIISTRGAGGGISLIDGYTLNKSLFSREEQENIFQSLRLLQATRYPHAELTLRKIGAIFGQAQEPQWLDIDFTFWGSDEEQKTDLSTLQSAILSKHPIAFDYFNSELQKSERIIEPLQLAFKSRTWYVVGYCRSRQEIRIFRISRMKHIRVRPETFTRELPHGYSLSGNVPTECNFPVFKLKFAPEIAYRLYDDFQEYQMETCSDGSFGKYVEILEPKIARTLLKERALEIANIYENI